jgi:hypothetical protein
MCAAGFAGAGALPAEGASGNSGSQTVQVASPWIDAADLSGRSELVNLNVQVSSATPVADWRVEVSSIGDPSVMINVVNAATSGVDLVAGAVTAVPVGRSDSPHLADAGRHFVSVVVTNQAGEKTVVRTWIRVRGAASTSIGGVSGSPKAGRSSLVWGKGSFELEGRQLKVEFKATGSKTYKPLGTVKVRKTNGYWVLRSKDLTTGTVRVVADTPYIGKTKAKAQVTATDFTKSHPNFSKKVVKA